MPVGGAGRRVDEEIPVPGLGSSRAAEAVIAAATRAGFVVTATGPTQYRLSRTYRPGWVVPTAIVGVLFFGLGLLLLLLVPKRNETCLATVNEGRRGVTVRLSGVLPDTLIAQIRADLGARTASPPTVYLPAAGLPASPPGAHSLPDVRSVSPPAPARAVSASSPMTPVASPWAPVVDVASQPPAHVDATVARSSIHVGEEVRGPSIRIGVDVVPVAGGVVIGRNPAPVDVLPSARLLPVADAGLSKTHLAIRVTGSMIEVCDLSSTNGTAVESGAVRRQCAPGMWLAVNAGDVVVAGDQRMAVNP